MSMKVIDSKLSVSYTYSQDGVILLRKFHEELTMEMMIESWKGIIDNDMISSNVRGVVSDFSQCNINIGLRDLKQFFVFIENNKGFFGKIKIAEVIDSPKIALPMIFKGRYGLSQLEVFSTKEKAIEWIYSF